MADDTKTGTEDQDDASKRVEEKPRTIAEEVGLPPRPLESPQSPPPTSVPENDIAHVLEEIKLPQRKEFRAAADIPVPAPEATAPQAPEVLEQPIPEIPTPKEGVAAVHTLKDDLKSAVYDSKMTLVQAAALEEEKRTHKGQVIVEDTGHPQRQRIMGILIIVGAFLLLGSIALGAVFLIIRDRAGVAPSTFLVDGLLFSEQTIPFSLGDRSATDLKRVLTDTRNSSGLTLGAITQIVPLAKKGVDETGTPIEFAATTREFLSAIGAHAPEELLRALSDEFFFGFHTVDENAPMLIIPVTSYERAFAGMLTWEKTLNADLGPVFTALPPLIRQSDGLLVERTFEDAVMRNFDVRVLKDDSNTAQLYYSFPTRELLIISESPFSFAEILSRLRADRRL